MKNYSIIQITTVYRQKPKNLESATLKWSSKIVKHILLYYMENPIFNGLICA